LAQPISRRQISPERNFDAEVSAEAAVAASRFVADELSPALVAAVRYWLEL